MVAWGPGYGGAGFGERKSHQWSRESLECAL